MRYPTKSVCICDLGLFVSLAEHLSSEFGKTYYWSPWVSRFPQSNQTLLGTGIPGVERLSNIWEKIIDIDLFVFPDVFLGPLQTHLRKLGKRVWGSAMAEELELFRGHSKRALTAAGMKVAPWQGVKGMSNLREYLKDNPNQYVKTDVTRGDMETFKAETYRMIEPRLDELDHHFGARKEHVKFTVEAGIDNAVPNLGYDGYTIDGEWPDKAMIGVEQKDKSYVGIVKDRKDWPKQIAESNAKVSPMLKEYEARTFFTLEMIIDKKGDPFIIDPCARFSSPCGELVQLMIQNLAEVLWEGAAGNLVQPEMAGKYGVEVLITSDWSEKQWMPVRYPGKVGNQVKLYDYCIIDRTRYVIPQVVAMSEIGAVVAVGNSMKEACASLEEVAEQVSGYRVEIDCRSLDEASAQIKKLADFGIKL
jgi:hypothetical protein